MYLIISKEPFETTIHRVIARKAGERIRIPAEDYEEVKDKCELVKDLDEKPKIKKQRRVK